MSKDPVGMHKVARETAKQCDWTSVVLRTNWDFMDLGSCLSRALSFKPDDLTTEDEFADNVADAFISLYTLSYKFDHKKIFEALKKKVEKRNEYLERLAASRD